MERLYLSCLERKCPYNCIYCFNDNSDYRQGKLCKEALKNNYKQINCETIQPACDAELLLSNQWKEILYTLTEINANISFATKKSITDDEVQYLSEINDKLKKKGKILNVGVTICRYDKFRNIEPYAPTPDERIIGLKRLYYAGIGCNVIIRPLFPDSTIDDLKKIVRKTKEYCYGYLLGPLYMNDAIKKYFQKYNVLNVQIQKTRPAWNQDELMEVVYSPELEKQLEEFIVEKGKAVFNNNAECVKAIREMIMQNKR